MMYHKPDSSCCNTRSANGTARGRSRLRTLSIGLLVGFVMSIPAPSTVWANESATAALAPELAPELVPDARESRRTTLRRALTNDNTWSDENVQVRSLSRKERAALNRELREAMRSAYDEHLDPRQ